MNGFINVTKFELKKILSRKNFILVPIIEVIVISLIGILLLFDTSILYSKFQFRISIPNISLIMLGLFSSTILPIKIFMLVSELFTSEFKNNTIKNILLRPVSRFTVFFAKNIAVLFYIFINLMLIFFATLILKIIFGYPLYSEFQTFIAFIVTMLPLFIIIVFSSFIACISKSSSMAMFTLVIAYLILNGLSLISSKFYTITFTSYINFYKIFLSDTLPISYILNIILLLGSSGVIFFILGYNSFNSKDI